MGAAIVMDFVSMLKLAVSFAWALRNTYASIYQHCVVWSLRVLESQGLANLHYAIMLYILYMIHTYGRVL